MISENTKSLTGSGSYQNDYQISQQILTQFKQLGVSLTLDDMLKPQPKVIDNIYSTCVKYCLSIKNEDMMKISIKGLNHINAETDDQAISRLNSFILLKKLMQLVGVEDISMRDIMSPEKSRTLRNLQAIARFIKYQQEQYTKFKDQIEQNKELELKCGKMKSDIEKLKEEMEKLKLRKEREYPQFVMKKEQLKQLQDESFKKIQVKQDLLEKKGELEAGKKEIEAQIVRSDSDIRQISSDIEKLKERIVKSPLKITQKIEQLDNELSLEKDFISKIDEEIKQLIFKKEVKETFYNQFRENCYNLVLEINNQTKLINKLKKQHQEIKDQQSKLDKEYNDTIDHVTQMKSQLEIQLQKNQDIEKNSTQKLETLEKQLKSQLEQNNINNANLNKLKVQLNELQDMDQNIQLQIEKVRVNISQAFKDHQDFVSNLTRQTSEYVSNIELALQNLQPVQSLVE